MTAPRDRAPDPLHGVTLERMLTEMVAHFGWQVMGQRIKVRCFTSDPSIPSSLRFLRRTPWARERVESMYLYMLREQARRRRASGESGGGSGESGEGGAAGEGREEE
ncbi:MAG: VF530 family protein [Gemmatimonadaceae bacterium]